MLCSLALQDLSVRALFLRGAPIKGGPDVYLGTDKRGRAHWRLHEQAPVAPPSYRGEHEAPDQAYAAPLHDLTGNAVYPPDIYGADGLRCYATGEPECDNEAWSKIQTLKGHPNRLVSVYRAVPKDVKGPITPGDWVTIVRRYATQHGRASLKGDFKIQTKLVRARDLFTDGNSWLEYGYYPQPRAPRGPRAGGQTPPPEAPVLLLAAPAQPASASPAWPPTLRSWTQTKFPVKQYRPARISFMVSPEGDALWGEGDEHRKLIGEMVNGVSLPDALARHEYVRGYWRGRDTWGVNAKSSELGLDFRPTATAIRNASAVLARFKPDDIYMDVGPGIKDGGHFTNRATAQAFLAKLLASVEGPMAKGGVRRMYLFF